MRVSHIHIVVPIHKEHVKAFLAYGGAVLMLVDISYTVIAPHVLGHLAHTYEPNIAAFGKTGAAMNGLVFFFERFFRS